jgi:hypothetical protein
MGSTSMAMRMPRGLMSAEPIVAGAVEQSGGAADEVIELQDVLPGCGSGLRHAPSTVLESRVLLV